MGNSTVSKPKADISSSSVVHDTKSLTSSKCPVDHVEKSGKGGVSGSDGCPVNHGRKFSDFSASNGGCPVQHGDISSESSKFSHDRVASTIPGASPDNNDSKSTWQYPSSQMFYNALKKKNKADNVTSENVDTIVSIHNTMNEQTWREILKYEALHYRGTLQLLEEKIKIIQGLDEKVLPIDKQSIIFNLRNEIVPRLVSFQGRPTEITPKAWINQNILQLIKKDNERDTLFDRHDWIVQRRLLTAPNKLKTEEHRYVIDYYYNGIKGAQDERPKHLHDITAIKSIKIDARPALDSFSAAEDRLRLALSSDSNNENAAKLELNAPDSCAQPLVQISKEKSTISSSKELMTKSNEIQTKCHDIFQSLQNCSSEDECSKLSLKMMICMGNVICPATARQAVSHLENSSDKSFEDLGECLESFETLAKVLGPLK